MRSGHIKLTSPNGFYGDTESIGVRVSMRCVSLCSLLFCIINCELTVLRAWLTPPPRLTSNKFYISQDGMDFRVMLSLSCLRALCLVRSVSSRAFFYCRIRFLPDAFYPCRCLSDCHVRGCNQRVQRTSARSSRPRRRHKFGTVGAVSEPHRILNS